MFGEQAVTVPVVARPAWGSLAWALPARLLPVLNMDRAFIQTPAEGIVPVAGAGGLRAAAEGAGDDGFLQLVFNIPDKTDMRVFGDPLFNEVAVGVVVVTDVAKDFQAVVPEDALSCSRHGSGVCGEAARQPGVVGGFRGGIRQSGIDVGLRLVICAGIDVSAGIGAIKIRQAQRKQEAEPDDKSIGGFRLWAGLAVCVG